MEKRNLVLTIILLVLFAIITALGLDLSQVTANQHPTFAEVRGDVLRELQDTRS